MSAAEMQLVATSHCQLCTASGSVTGADIGQGAWGAELCKRGAEQPSSRLTRVQIFLHKSCCSGNAHKSHQLHGSELPHNPIRIFFKSPDFCPMSWGRVRCTSSSGSVYQQGMWQGSQDLASWPPVGSALSARLLLRPRWLHQAAHHGQIKH